MKWRNVLLAAVLLVAGCGVSTESDPRGVSPPPGPFAGLTSPRPSAPATAATGRIDEVLYFILAGRLVPVTRRVDLQPSVTELISALRAGPAPTEREAGLTTALGGTDVVAAVSISGSRVELALAAPVEGSGRADEALAYAQLVCTLTAHADIQDVVFTRDGSPVGVPRGDGSLSEGPLTADDYSRLLGG
ncbi:MAG: GerMN domain-containing protein [Hamadaea sp.]|uniref:GerMN domain-containing protein n=1 Tax=Hamadaea sp. TaxID=2024425 RepID=UPI00183E03CB|nr:GerMN domain-containing protein [Hamadaea sp.]NUR69704.1 GerMN domain-containing protein [Hamadaea sp.]NUT19572.1 GerMN domain-containing protein [Hamadaea sp.]